MSSVAGGSEKPSTTSDGHIEAVDSVQTLRPRPSVADDSTMNADCRQTLCETDFDATASAITTELFTQTSNCDAAADSAAATESLIPSSAPPRTLLFRRRWLIIFLFASYSMSNAYQWIHLNIIFDKVCLFVTLFHFCLYIVSISLAQYCQYLIITLRALIFLRC